MAESVSDWFLTDFYLNPLQLTLPDNEQTWLYCLPGSDPKLILDLSEFLCFDTYLFDKCNVVAPEKNCASSHVKTLLPQRRSNNFKEKRIGKLNYPIKKATNNLDASSNNEESSTLLVNLPIQPTQLNLKHKLNNEDIAKIELNGADLVAQPVTDESLIMTVPTSDASMKNHNSWNTSERTLLFNVSAPKGFMDSTITSASSTDSSFFPKFNFNPNSVSTPTKKLVCDNKNENYINSENINPESPVNTSTFDDRANDTYCVLSDDEINEQSKDVSLNTTTVISSSNTKTENCADVIEEIDQSGVLQSTYIFEDPVPTTFNEEADFNSTITIKSKDSDDSEQDSCYSSSSNIRSLGDVCYMSQLKPQKINAINSGLKKNKSEDSLCLPEHASNSEKPKKHYGSALSLGPQNNNQLTADSIDSGFKKNKSEDYLCLPEHSSKSEKPKKYYGSALSLGPQNINKVTADRRLHQNPNYFSRRTGNQIVVPNVSSENNNDKSASMEKPMPTRQLSKIPRPQSRIPKLVSKK